MRINFRFEAPIIQVHVQIITYIIYSKCACVWRQVLGAARIMEISTYFSRYSRQVNIATCFLVLRIDKENSYDYWEGDYIYIYNVYTNMSSSRHHILAISPAVKHYRVGDNRRTVNTSTTPHISDQLGIENACKTLLCWFIVMIRILVCNNIYQYQHYFWSFYHNPRRFRFIVYKWVNTEYFFF